MSTRHPQAGDGIVDNLGGRWVVDGLSTDSITKEITGVNFTDKEGRRRELLNGQFHLETFAEYLTRPTGFGRTSWVQFALIQAACIALVIAGVSTWADGGLVACAMAATIEAVLLWQSHRNYTGKTR